MTDIIPTNIKLPAHLRDRLGQPSNLGAALVGGIKTGEGFPRISLKASRFRIVRGDQEKVLNTLELPVIIVGANPHVSKTFYEKKWSPGDEPTAPDCSSKDGIRPDPEIEEPVSDGCAACPMNVWGSAITDDGKKAKRCIDTKRLAVVDAANPGGDIYQLTVTPSALRALNDYNKELVRRGIPPEVVVTTLCFDDSVSYPRLLFKFGGFIDEQNLPIVEELFGSDRVKDITGESREVPIAIVATETKTKPKPKPIEEVEVEVVQPKPKAKPAPVVEVEDVEETYNVVPIKASARTAPVSAFGSDEDEDEAPPPRASKAAAPTKAVAAQMAREFGGFGEQEPAPAPKKARVTKEPAAGKEASGDDLANQIANMLEGLDDD